MGFIHLVYFNLYDCDGDGKITSNDLLTFLRIIDHKNSTIVELKYKSIERFFDPIVEHVFNELIHNRKRTYISYETFKNLMWETSIDKKCVIYLDDF